MPENEAPARIKINGFLKVGGWRFFSDGNDPANIRLEPTVAIKPADLDSLGEILEKADCSFIDFLLFDARDLPLKQLGALTGDNDEQASQSPVTVKGTNITRLVQVAKLKYHRIPRDLGGLEQSPI